jgi:hypothetical protein
MIPLPILIARDPPILATNSTSQDTNQTKASALWEEWTVAFIRGWCLTASLHLFFAGIRSHSRQQLRRISNYSSKVWWIRTRLKYLLLRRPVCLLLSRIIMGTGGSILSRMDRHQDLSWGTKSLQDSKILFRLTLQCKCNHWSSFLQIEPSQRPQRLHFFSISSIIRRWLGQQTRLRIPQIWWEILEVSEFLSLY